jgi:integrase
MDGEEERLLQAAREEDRIRSRNRAIQDLLEPARAEAEMLDAGKSTRNRFITAARLRIESGPHPFEVEPVYETLIASHLATAARGGEVLGQTWKHTNLMKGTAFFPETKNGNARTVPLRSHLVDLLERLKATRNGDDPRVFPVSIDTWDAAWERIRERAGLDEDFRRHDLRHEGISQIAEAGHQSGMPFDVVTLAAITGHRDLRSLQRYINLDKGRLAIHMDHVFDEARRRESTHKGRLRLTKKFERQLMQPAESSEINHEASQTGDAMGLTLSQRLAI